MKNYIDQKITCPHCGAHTQVECDASQGDQDFYQDCVACCNTIHFKLHRDEEHNKLILSVSADDEQYY